jgi:hypothetical protein
MAGHLTTAEQPPPQAGNEGHESQAGDCEVFPTAKPEGSLLMSGLPHFSQVGLSALTLLCSTSITCPHFSHRYSNIGMFHILLNQ